MTEAHDLRTRADAVLELHESGDLEAALVLATDLAANAASRDVEDPVVRESLFAARFETALLLTELGDLGAAAEAYGEAAGTPADLDDPDQRHEIAMALLNQGICLAESGDAAAAIDAYDQVVARFGDADDAVTRDQVARARVNRAASLLAVDRASEAVAGADELASELDPADTLDAEQLAMAVRVKAAALRAMERTREAAESLAAVERCTAEDPAIRTQIAAAQGERAELLAELGRLDEAISLLDTVVGRLGDDPDPDVLEVVTNLIDDEVRLLEAVGDTAGAAAVRSQHGA